MKNWKLTIDVAELWQNFKKNDHSFNEFSQNISSKLETYTTKIQSLFGLYVAGNFEYLIEEIKGCEDVEEFDYIWANLYDWADYNSVWIKTF